MLTEVNRPRSLAEIKNQPEAVKFLSGWLRAYKDTGTSDVFLIVGNSGSGKTSVAHAMAAELGVDFSFITIDSRSCTLETVQSLRDDLHLAAWNGSRWKVFLIDEAHTISVAARDAFLSVLETIPRWNLICFTTTVPEHFDLVWRSRCKLIELKAHTQSGIVDIMSKISDKVSETDMKKIAASAKGNARAALHSLEMHLVSNPEAETFEIRVDKKEIAVTHQERQEEQQAELIHAAMPCSDSPEFTVRPGLRDGFVEILFAKKPEASIIAEVKRAGFRFCAKGGEPRWYGKETAMPARYRNITTDAPITPDGASVVQEEATQTWSLREKIDAFIALCDKDYRGYMARMYPNNPLDKYTAKWGKKYVNIDLGGSGKYMVDQETGEIFGIKAYGKIHKGHRYGTLHTVTEWYWGDHYGIRKTDIIAQEERLSECKATLGIPKIVTPQVEAPWSDHGKESKLAIPRKWGSADKGAPEPGKQYHLTAFGSNAKSIAKGNTWAESEVKSEATAIAEEVDNTIVVKNAGLGLLMRNEAYSVVLLSTKQCIGQVFMDIEDREHAIRLLDAASTITDWTRPVAEIMATPGIKAKLFALTLPLEETPIETPVPTVTEIATPEPSNVIKGDFTPKEKLTPEADAKRRVEEFRARRDALRGKK